MNCRAILNCPYGTKKQLEFGFPVMKCRAILSCPYGTKKQLEFGFPAMNCRAIFTSPCGTDKTNQLNPVNLRPYAVQNLHPHQTQSVVPDQISSDGRAYMKQPVKIYIDADSFEFQHGLDPYNPDDASGDRDEDGLTNLEEYELGTNPNLEDTDDDGLSDGYETDAGLDISPEL